MTKSRFYGFEDYNVLSFSYECFIRERYTHLPYCFDTIPVSYIIAKDLSVQIIEDYYGNPKFSPEPYKDNKELLSTAKKVYVHDSCKISRTLLSSKYKKSLNPWLSDAVIVPKFDTEDYYLFDAALFVNDRAKIIVVFHLYNVDTVIKYVNTFKPGDKLANLLLSRPSSYYAYTGYTIDDVMNAEFIYTGNVLRAASNRSYILDILTHSIPADKTVYEETVQESLSDESNQLSLETMISIKEMIDSSDNNTVSAGLKALSMMDWVHYPNSIRYIINNTNTSKWRYNKACNSTSVKYMFTTLAGKNSRRWPGSEDGEIYEEDLNLYKQLKMHYESLSPDKLLNSLASCNFMRVSADGNLFPVIKERAV